MKSIFKIALVAVVALSLNSCVSVQKGAMSRREMAEAGVIGQVSTTYTSFQPFHFTSGAGKKAHDNLLRIAREQYDSEDINIDDIDIVNIRAKGGFSKAQLLFVATTVLGFLIFDSGAAIIEAPLLLSSLAGNFQRVNATADVVLRNQGDSPRGQTVIRRSSPPPTSKSKSVRGIEGAIQKTSLSLIENLPLDAKIAVINVNSNDRGASAFVINELEFHLVSAKNFTIVDRHTLDAIRKEQNFQMGGDVSDVSVVAIGELAGASVVITGEITDVGRNKRLSLKALDVKTGRIIAMAREQY